MKFIHICLQFTVLYLVIGTVLCSPLNNTTGEECSADNGCAQDKICVDHKCIDPCLGVCGLNTVCVVDHPPMCSCRPGYQGDPTSECKPEGSNEKVTDKKPGKVGKKNFFISDIKTNWLEAYFYCGAHNMNLATVNDVDEWNDLINAWESKQYPQIQLWLGGHDLGIYKNFIWVTTAKRLSFTKWNYNQPTNEYHHCLGLEDNYGWSSQHCSNIYYFACEST